MFLNLNNYKEQLSSLESLKQRQINEIKEQKSNRVIYNKRLSDLQKRQEELRKTLEDLQITSKPPAKANQNVRHYT